MSDNTDLAAALLGIDKEELEKQRKRANQIEVHCPECDTSIWKDDMEAAVDKAESHDEKRHDGEATTEVAGLVPPSFTEEEKEEIQDAVQMFEEGDSNE